MEKSAAEDHLPWVEKYRPKSLDDVLAHQHIISTINRLIDSNSLPHLLFYGPPGTGKTSTILACAERLFGQHTSSMILELNASDDNGIDIVRSKIKNFAGTRKLFSKGIKLIILDEADNLSSDAQSALRRVIEKYSSNTRFCLICNYVSKIIPAIQSRCTRFRFAPLARKEMTGRISEIAALEKCEITPDGLEALLKLSEGDMRRILNIMQACTMAAPKVDEDSVYNTTGKPHPKDIGTILQSLLNDSYKQAFDKILGIQTAKGLALVDIVTEIAAGVMSLSLPGPMKCYILKNLSDIEFTLVESTSEDLQLGGVISAFFLARHMATPAK
eukprot:INCI1654.1.p1 GENE.INCI1654.1~~INCI1654.1.p1  ORF type:complete len:364 (+),score=60.32 INCI1654.1:104-1093(+)